MKRKYTTKSCHNKKSAAKTVQKTMHNSGLTARIVEKKVKVGKKTVKKYCVESAGKRKK
jgi:hypothetical protein